MNPMDVTESKLHQELFCPNESLAGKKKKKCELTEEVGIPCSPVIKQNSTANQTSSSRYTRILPHCNYNIQWAYADPFTDFQTCYYLFGGIKSNCEHTSHLHGFK